MFEMGCSPSKGNNFGTQGPFRRGRSLLPETQDCPGEPQYDDGEGGGSSVSAEGDFRERMPAGPPHCTQREPPLTPQKKRASVSELAPAAVTLDKQGMQGMDVGRVTPGKEKQGEKQDATEKKTSKKPKKNNRGVKPAKKKEKDKKATLPEQKVDFPEPLVKAHQSAYAFLNPSINKYDILLGLLEQATQTQVNVQPMVAFMVLRYEEINRALEGVVDEGERLLKENGEHLAWPSPIKNLSSSSLKMDSEPPPDLLQQLLQYTTQRMRNVSQTVGGIGDSAMEEAVEYFASVSELLDEKLKAKHAIEARLMRLLTRIEVASLRKPGPEDSSLFSEDSGIGAENESLAGSERHLRRGSGESTGTNRTTPSPMRCNNRTMRQAASKPKVSSKMSPSVSITSLDSICTLIPGEQKDTESLLGSVSLDDEEDADEEETDGDTGDSEVFVRKRSNSSPAKPDQKPCRLPPKRIENPKNVEMTLKMKDAISGRIQFVPSQHACAKAKLTESPKTSRRQWAEDEDRPPRRPQTAAPVRKGGNKKSPVAKERRTRSTESLRSKAEDPTLLELERTQRDLSQRIERMCRQTGTNTANKVPSKQTQGNAPMPSTAASRIHPALEKNSRQPIKDKAGLMKQSNEEQEATRDVGEDKKKKDKKKTSKGPLKATPPPSPPPSRPPSGLSRGRNSVKRLIDTFSQGIEELESPKVLGPLKGVRRCGVPVLPGLGNMEAALSSRLTSCRAESMSTYKMDDLDLANLPPPPLEVLLDNSFEGAQSISSETDERTVGKKATVSRLRASVQSVAVLPSKGSLPQSSRVVSTGVTDYQETSAEAQSQSDLPSEVDSDVEHAASLYKHSRKIIHLRHSSDSALDNSSFVPTSALSPAASAEEEDVSCRPTPGSSDSLCMVTPTSVVGSLPPSTPTTSRARMLPSTPTTSSSHRRLPSPHAFTKQPGASSSISPPNNRKLPTPPAVQRMLPSSPIARQCFPRVNSASSNSSSAPSPPASPKVHRRNNVNTNSVHSFVKAPSPPASPKVQRQNISNANSASSYRFKAPSPPASPKVQRWARENSGEDSSTRPKSNARSVFCPVSPSLFEAQPCPPQAWASTGVPVLPRSWRNLGKLPPFVRGPQPFIRRSHSDRRPSLTLPLRPPGNYSVAEMCGSEPSINTQGLEDEPAREELWSVQSDLRAKARSASHPDLCVVGQALHLE